jgi:hypothetical protein
VISLKSVNMVLIVDVFAVAPNAVFILFRQSRRFACKDTN